MAVTLELTTWERLQLLQSLPPKGPISQLVQAMRVGDALDLNEAEREQVGMVVNTENGEVRWADREASFQVQIDHADLDFLINAVKNREWDYTGRSKALLMKLTDVSGKDLGLG